MATDWLRIWKPFSHFKWELHLSAFFVGQLLKSIIKAKQEGFRNNPVKENKIKRALYQILNDEDEVERVYQIVVEQEEY